MHEPMTPPTRGYQGDSTWTLGRSDASLPQLPLDTSGEFRKVPNLRSPMRLGGGRQLPSHAWEVDQQALRSAAHTPCDRPNVDAALADAVKASAQAMVNRVPSSVTDLRVQVAALHECLEREGHQRAQHEARLASKFEQLRLDTSEQQTEVVTSLRAEFSDVLDSFGRKHAELKSQVSSIESHCSGQLDQFMQQNIQHLSDRVDVLCRTALDMEAVNTLLDSALIKHAGKHEQLLNRVAKLEAFHSEYHVAKLDASHSEQRFHDLEELSSSGLQRLADRVSALAGKHAKSAEIHSGLEERLQQLSSVHEERHGSLDKRLGQLVRDHSKDAEDFHTRLEELGRTVDLAMGVHSKGLDSQNNIFDQRLKQFCSIHDERHDSFAERQAYLEEKLGQLSQDHARHSDDIHKRVEELGSMLGKNSQGLESHSNLIEQRLKQITRTHEDRHSSMDQQFGLLTQKLEQKLALLSQKHEDRTQGLQACVDDRCGQLSQNHDRNAAKLHARLDDLQALLDATCGKHSQSLDLHANAVEQRLRQFSGMHDDRHSALEAKFGQFSEDHARSWSSVHKRLDEFARLLDSPDKKHAHALEADANSERHRSHEDRISKLSEDVQERIVLVSQAWEDSHNGLDERLKRCMDTHKENAASVAIRIEELVKHHGKTKNDLLKWEQRFMVLSERLEALKPLERQVNGLREDLEELIGKHSSSHDSLEERVEALTDKHAQIAEKHGGLESRLGLHASKNEERHGSLEDRLSRVTQAHDAHAIKLHKRIDDLQMTIDGVTEKHVQGYDTHGMFEERFAQHCRKHDDRLRSLEERLCRLTQDDRVQVLLARVDERHSALDQRLEQVSRTHDDRAQVLLAHVDERHAALDQRLDQISRAHDDRSQTLLARVDERHSALDKRLEKLAQHAAIHDDRAQMLQSRVDERHATLEQRLDQISRTHEDQSQKLWARTDERHSALDKRLDKLAQDAAKHDDRAQMLQARVDERHAALDQRLDQISCTNEDQSQKLLARTDERHAALDQRFEKLALDSRAYEDRAQILQARVDERHAALDKRLDHISRTHEDQSQKLLACADERHAALHQRLDKLAQDSRAHDDRAQMLQSRVDERHAVLDKRLDQISRTHEDQSQKLLARTDERHAALDQRLDKLAQDSRAHADRAQTLQACGDEQHSALDQRLDQISRVHEDRAQKLLVRLDEQHAALGQRLDHISRTHEERAQKLLARTDERHSVLDQRLDKLVTEARTQDDRAQILQARVDERHSVLDQRLDNLTQSHKEHADGMHRRFEELGKLHGGTQNDVQRWEQRLSALSDRFDGVKHVDNGLKMLGDHVEALKHEHTKHKAAHTQMQESLKHHGLQHGENLSTFSEQVSKRFQEIDVTGPLNAALERTDQAWQQQFQECLQARSNHEKEHVTKVSALLDERHDSMQKRLKDFESKHEQIVELVTERIKDNTNSMSVELDGRHSKLHSRLDNLERAHDQNMDMIRVRIQELSSSSKESVDWEERFAALASYLKREIARVEAVVKSGQDFREALDQLAGQVGALADGLSAETRARDGLAQSVDRLFRKQAQEDSKRQLVESHLQKLTAGEMQLLREMKRDNDNMAQEILRAVTCHPAEEAGGAARPVTPRSPAALSVLRMAPPQVSKQAQADQVTFAPSVPMELVPKQDVCRICGTKFLGDATACIKCGCKRPLLEGSPGMIRSLHNAVESETNTVINLLR